MSQPDPNLLFCSGTSSPVQCLLLTLLLKDHIEALYTFRILRIVSRRPICGLRIEVVTVPPCPKHSALSPKQDAIRASVVTQTAFKPQQARPVSQSIRIPITTLQFYSSKPLKPPASQSDPAGTGCQHPFKVAVSTMSCHSTLSDSADGCFA